MKQYHKIQTVFKRDAGNRHKTILEGVFSIPEFEFLQNTQWVWTEKVDGTNIRVMFDGQDEIRFGGKTDNAQIPTVLANRLNDLFLPQLKVFREKFPETEVCLYGEGYGAKIQKVGANYLADSQDFVLFDIRIGPWWLERDSLVEIGEAFGIPVVPIIGEGTIAEMVEFVREGFNSQWGDFPAEGVVARPAMELKTRGNERIIAKLKHRDFTGG